MTHIILLYTQFIKVYLKSKVEYRFGFFTELVGYSLTNIINYLVIWMLMTTFQSMNGWNMHEVMFIYTINMFTYAVAAVFFYPQMKETESMVYQGSFDTILTKPLNPMIHMVIRSFGYLFFGDIILSIILFIVIANEINIQITLMNSIMFLIMLFGAVLIQASFIILSGSACFWFVRTTAITNILLYDLRKFMNYPISIYNKFIKIILTFVFPYAFINFYPAQYFLDKENGNLFSPIFQYMTPIVGILFFIISYLVWKKGVNSYQGTGS
ncbi:ABC transporter permease [Paenibacillus xylaniclasticus]|uniref:ABC transporter permease n=1 Tax=Paenibacillus xylaniclasticus TaxID=588083 RepID=UPI000FD9FC64|nr:MULTISPECIES: ABC-2 family transporter protein [Paenibacillus]GFN30059.1 ABC transporter permease [Paenibacillus curdlanolyticus]